MVAANKIVWTEERAAKLSTEEKLIAMLISLLALKRVWSIFDGFSSSSFNPPGLRLSGV